MLTRVVGKPDVHWVLSCRLWGLQGPPRRRVVHDAARTGTPLRAAQVPGMQERLPGLMGR